jgi:hypothetical protein
MFKSFLDKAKEVAKNVDVDSVKKVANEARSTVQSKMKEHGVDEVIEKVKEEGKIIGKAVSNAANEVYKENEEVLEKPVGMASKAVKKVTKHSEEIKWAGGIVAGVVAPIPTLLATTAIFLLSEDEMTEEQKKESEELKKADAQFMTNSYIEVKVDTNQSDKSKIIEGKVLSGSFEGQTFEEIGVDKMKTLKSILETELKKDEEKELGELSPAKIKEMSDTILLVERWIKFQ